MLVNRRAQFGWVIAALGLGSTFWIAWASTGPRISQENGPMENFQAVCLALSLLFFLFNACRENFKAQKIIQAGLALFCATILIRELEFKNAANPALQFLLNGAPRNILVLTAWLALMTIVIPRVNEVWLALLGWSKTASGRLVLLGCVLYLLSWPWDKGALGPHGLSQEFVEELLDSNATLAFVQAAWFNWRRPAGALSDGVAVHSTSVAPSSESVQGRL